MSVRKRTEGCLSMDILVGHLHTCGHVKSDEIKGLCYILSVLVLSAMLLCVIFKLFNKSQGQRVGL